MSAFEKQIGKWAVTTCLAAAAWHGGALAQSYPAKPVRMSVGFAPGGIADIVTRVVAQYLATPLGQAVIVENRAGADGRIQLQQLATAAPDGYSIGLSDSGLAVNAVLFATKTYDPVKDFTPLLYLGEVPNFIAVSPALNVNTLTEFVDYAKARPGKLNYAATASSTMLAAELFKAVAGVDLVRVSYKGQAFGLPALMAGDVQLMVSAVGPLAPLAKQGKLKALAVSALKRTHLAPEVPTATEAGLPGMVYVNWYVVLGPAGLPRAVADRLQADLRKVMAEPAVMTRLREMGIEQNIASPDEFINILGNELAKMEKIVKSASLKIE
ncbi:MAG: tripartite tricarboxylate transporter substrate binding protein [Betaproteobacteria bacterium]|nr:tripartite tricarboxylate transporter substrate binding protein [Betaproteobacteria bacterium]